MSERPFLNDQHVSDLITFGMPPAVAQHIQVTRGLRKVSCVGVIIGQILLLIVGMLGTLIGLSMLPLDRFGIWMGLIPHDAWLVTWEPVSAVAAVFLGICVSALTFFLMLNLRSVWRIPTAISGIQLSMKGGRDAVNRWANGAMMKAVIRRIDPELPIDRYLEAYSLGCIRLSLVACLSTFLVMIVIFVWDLTSAGFAGPEGICCGGHFATDRRITAWSEITKLQTGSYRMGTTHTLRYVLHRSDGRSLNLADAHSPDDSESSVIALARVDQIVREHQIPWEPSAFEGGRYKGIVQWDPEVFHSCRNKLPAQERAIFQQIYRFSQDEF